MKKPEDHKGIIIIVLILVFGAFYWFQVRPANIIKECSKHLGGFGSGDDSSYKKCLAEKGYKNW